MKAPACKKLMLLIITVCILFSVAAGGEYGEVILQAEDALIGSGDLEYENILAVRDEAGREKVYRLIVYRKGEDAVIKFLKPDVERGRIVLVQDKAGYMFFPNTSRPMRVTLQSGLMGSGFSIGDISANLLVDYDCESYRDTVVQGRACKTFILERSESGKGHYSSIHYTISPENTPIAKDYYSLSGKHLKTLTLSEGKSMDGKVVPTIWKMESRISNEVTIVKVVGVKRGVSFEERMFTIEYVKTMMR
ncbi:MAG: outer membrane lipoprotein-sorting protein [Candidatus Lokiarchaeota archaeon]|nr:outer membrane lipoprotein-sorting protein [Candidatus Lokiarchaeota archaeon]MBD3239294.1 outer membrane lipoprotein-sorting protein [Chitinivibrionales bacterium]